MKLRQSSAQPPATTISTLVAAGFLLALWIATRPYFGIIHDARLYLLQSLYSLEPGDWNQDIYFRYGTQDSFSIFSSGYRLLITKLGVSQANLTATIVGDTLWLAGLVLLVCTILKRPTERLAAICGVLALDPSYGGLDIFHYAEPFVTPRLFAEAIVMGGLALAIQMRYLWASILFFLAIVIHPLIAIPGIGMLAFHKLRRDSKIWTIFGIALAIGVTGTGLGIDPFTRILEFYDPNWFQIINGRTDFALISAWTFGDYAQTTSTFLILGIFLTVANDRERRFVTSLIIVAIAGLVISFLGVDLIHNVLITNLQLWRAMWLANLASNVAIILMVLRSKGISRTIFVIVAALSFLSHFLFGPRVVVPFAIILCLLWLLHKRLAGRRRIQLSIDATVLVVQSFVFILIGYAFYVQTLVDRHIDLHLEDMLLAAAALLGLAWNAKHPPGRWLIIFFIGTLATSGVLADQRTSWNRYVYGPIVDYGLKQFLADSGTTYWEGDNGTEALWFRARKPSYFSCLQGTESMFFRSQAMEWSKRQSALRNLNTLDFGTARCGLKMDPGANGPNSPAQIAAACQALPDLNTIILNHPIPGLPERSWTAPAYQEAFQHGPGIPSVRDGFRKTSTFYRYSCASLRKPLSK